MDRAPNLRKLAKLLGCSERTIYRHGKSLRAAGFRNDDGYDVEACRSHIWETDNRHAAAGSGDAPEAIDDDSGRRSTEIMGRKATTFGGTPVRGIPGTVGAGEPAVADDDLEQAELPDLEELRTQALQESVLYRTARRELEQHRLAVQRGEMVPRDAVERALATRYAEVRATFENLAPQLPPELEGLDHREQVVRLLDIYRRHIWEVFSRKDEVYPDGIPIKLAPPPERKGKRKR